MANESTFRRTALSLWGSSRLLITRFPWGAGLVREPGVMRSCLQQPARVSHRGDQRMFYSKNAISEDRRWYFWRWGRKKKGKKLWVMGELYFLLSIVTSSAVWLTRFHFGGTHVDSFPTQRCHVEIKPNWRKKWEGQLVQGPLHWGRGMFILLDVGRKIKIQETCI